MFEHLFNPAFKIDYSDNDKSLTVKERSPDAKLKGVTFTGFDEPPLAIELDHKDEKQLSRYLNCSEKSINKSCDCVIFFRKSKRWHLLFIELKSDKPTESEYIEQFMSSNLFIDYALKLNKEFKWPKQPEFKKTFILCTTRGSRRGFGDINNKARDCRGIHYIEQSCLAGDFYSTININKFIK